MNTKRILSVILSVVMLVSLAGFAAADDTITLKFQMWSDEEEMFDALIANYEASHPNIKIEMTCTPSNDYGAKLTTVLGGGSDVDAFGISSPPGLAEYQDKGAVLCLDDLIASTGYDMSGNEGIIDSTKIDGKVYSLPYKSGAWVVYYNKDVFDAAGVAYPTGDWTWEEYYDIAGKLTSGEGENKVYGSLNFQPTSMWWRVPANSKGATNPTKDDELHTWMEAAEFCKSLSDAGYQPLYEDMSGDIGGDYSGNFLQGKYGMMFTGDWAIEMLNTAIANGDGSINYDIAPLPHWEGTEAVTVGAPGLLMVAEGSTHQAEAFDFIAYCSGAEAAQTILAADHFPSWQDDAIIAQYCSGKTAPEHIEFIVNQKVISQVPCDANYNPSANIVKEEISLYLVDEQDIETTEENIKTRILDEVINAK